MLQLLTYGRYCVILVFDAKRRFRGFRRSQIFSHTCDVTIDHVTSKNQVVDGLIPKGRIECPQGYSLFAFLALGYRYACVLALSVCMQCACNNNVEERQNINKKIFGKRNSFFFIIMNSFFYLTHYAGYSNRYSEVTDNLQM